VIGSRYVRGGAMPDPRRYWASYAFNFLIRALVRTGVHDNLSGYFVAPGEWLRSIQEETVFYGYGDYFIRLVALAKRNGAKIVEIPVVYGLRPTGTSKTDLIRTPMRYFAAALRLAVGWDRPRLRAPSPTALAH
jgi:dolichol-phosphate mannosyltransferase